MTEGYRSRSSTRVCRRSKRSKCESTLTRPPARTLPQLVLGLLAREGGQTFSLSVARGGLWCATQSPVCGVATARRTTCKGARTGFGLPGPKSDARAGCGGRKEPRRKAHRSGGQGVCALRAPSNARPCSGCVLIRVNLFEPERPSGRVQCSRAPERPSGTHKHPTGALVWWVVDRVAHSRTRTGGPASRGSPERGSGKFVRVRECLERPAAAWGALGGSKCASRLSRPERGPKRSEDLYPSVWLRHPVRSGLRPASPRLPPGRCFAPQFFATPALAAVGVQAVRVIIRSNR